MDAKEYETLEEFTEMITSYKKYLVVKRLFDISFSIIALVLLTPTFLIVGLFVLFDGTKGKVFFSQERVGIGGNVFVIYKFRSMYPDAESRLKEIEHLNESEGNMFKVKEDPRITKIGRVIRAYSIDELPQLFNVLKGEMSLIGPRPSLLSEYANFTEYDKARLTVTPGITGLWQVSGRSSLTFAEMVELDLQYIRTMSFKLEMFIFIRTVIVIFKRENAY